MGLEYLQGMVGAFALGRVPSRRAVRDAFAAMNVPVPAASVADDAEPALETSTLLAYIDDRAGQVSFIIYDDRALPAELAAAFELLNGWAAASPADATTATEAFALARLVALTSTAVNLGDWVRPEYAAEPACPDQDELDALGKLRTVASFVVNDDGSLWKHGAKPPADLLDRSYSRVVSFNRTM